MCFKFLLLLVPFFAQAFTMMTEGLQGWDQGKVTFTFNPDQCARAPEEIESALQTGLAIWNQAPNANVHLVYGGRTDQTGDQANPVVECVTSGLGGIVGSGYVSTTDGRVMAGHVELNSDPSDDSSIGNLDADQLPIVLGHEVGHVMGLGHTALQASLMFYSVEGKHQLVISADDADGMAYLYPRHEPGSGVLGCGSLGPPAGGWGGGLLPWLGLAMLLTLYLRRPGRALSPL